MIFNESDKSLTVEEIELLMDEYDSLGSFKTRKHHDKEFYIHFIRLITSGHILSFRNNSGNLKGFCSWILADEDSKKEINKVRWILPKNIDSGDILYIPACLTTNVSMIEEIRRNLRSRFSDKVKTVIWFNVQRGKFFSVKAKGEKKCLTAD